MADPAATPVPVSDEPRPGTTDPRRSRVRALKVLFQADLKGEDPSATLADIAIDPNAVALLDDLDLDDDQVSPIGDAALDDYARVLVDGVATCRHRLDGIIGRFSHRWEVNRMPVVDRNILRLGVWELLFQQVSPAVVIDEAVELAKDLSGDASHRFINGILEAVRKEADTLRHDLAQPDPDDVADLVTQPDQPAVALDEPAGDAPDEPARDEAPVRERVGSSDVFDDHAIICTWNPETSYDLSDRERDEGARVTRAGGSWSGDWSIGRHRRGIGPGTVVYLFRQGRVRRGIVAKGVATSLPFEAPHWDESGRTARYVKIDWEVFLPEGQGLDVKRLRAQVPGGNWDHRYQSGSPLRQPSMTQLAELFARHLAQVGWCDQ